MRSLQPLTEAWHDPALLDGVQVGVVALLAVVLVVTVRRRGVAGASVPAAGVAFALASIVAIELTSPVPEGVVIGVVICGSAGVLLDLHRGALATGLLSVPGALLIASDAPPSALGEPWTTAGVLMMVAVGGPLVAAFDDRWRRAAVGPSLLFLTTGGIYSTVPDTEVALPMLGAAVALVALGWPLRIARLGGAGALAAVALLAWSITEGGRGRPGAVVGAIGCLGIMAVEPLLRACGARSPIGHLGPAGRAVVFVVVHAALVLWMARVAGLQQDAGPALVLAATGFVVGGVAWAIAGQALRAS